MEICRWWRPPTDCLVCHPLFWPSYLLFCSFSWWVQPFICSASQWIGNKENEKGKNGNKHKKNIEKGGGNERWMLWTLLRTFFVRCTPTVRHSLTCSFLCWDWKWATTLDRVGSSTNKPTIQKAALRFFESPIMDLWSMGRVLSSVGSNVIQFVYSPRLQGLPWKTPCPQTKPNGEPGR